MISGSASEEEEEKKAALTTAGSKKIDRLERMLGIRNEG
jgi:hypothetical protein